MRVLDDLATLDLDEFRLELMVIAALHDEAERLAAE